MSAVAVLGSAPISVLDSSGRQRLIPLALLAMRDGAVDTSRLDSAIATAAGPVLKALLGSGAIQADVASAPVQALQLEAVLTGPIGNLIEVSLANIVPNTTTPGASKVDVTVRFTDRRVGLTTASLAIELGAPAGGTSPTLVALKAAPAGLPAVTAATKLTGSPRELTIQREDGSGAAFTVTTGTGPLLGDVTVAVEAVNAAAGTFTLVVAVEHTAAALALTALSGRLAPLVTVTPGAGGFAPPDAGSITLSGGAPPRTKPAQPARASVLSG